MEYIEYIKKYIPTLYEKLESADEKGEVAVISPIIRKSGNYEKNVSFRYNINTHRWYDFTEKKGGSLFSLIEIIHGIGVLESDKYKQLPDNDGVVRCPPNIVKKIKALGITNEVIDDYLKYSNGRNELFTVEIRVGNKLINQVMYNPTETTYKYLGTKTVKTGLIFPFDTAIDYQDHIILVEGEKDCLIGLSKGFQTISITGGAGRLPQKELLKVFKNKEVWIIYDNDEAGKNGAKTVANYLFNNNIKVKIITSHYNKIQPKEDFYDLLVKYKTPKERILLLGKQAKYFTKKDSMKYEEYLYQKTTLKNIIDNYKIDFNQKYMLDIYVDTESIKTYSIPYELEAQWVVDNKKYKWKFINDFQLYNEFECLEFNKRQYGTRFKTAALFSMPQNIYDIYDSIIRMPKKSQPLIKILVNQYNKEEKSLYKYLVFDEKHTKSVYSYQKLTVGKNYRIFCKAMRIKGGEINLLIYKAYSLDDIRIEYTKELHKAITYFQQEKTIKKKLNFLLDNIKKVCQSNFNDDLLIVLLLSWFSISWIKGNRITNIQKGSVEVLVISNAGVGKSYAGNSLLKLFKAGEKITLSESTPKAIVGGTDIVSGFTKAGLVAKNHRGLILFEEIQSAGFSLKDMDNIRSEGISRPARVNKTLELESNFRGIYFSNPKTYFLGGAEYSSIVINNYNNRLDSIICSIIKTAETRNRFDLYFLITNKESQKSIFKSDKDENKLNKIQEYLILIKTWVWQLNINEIIFQDNIDELLNTYANELNKRYSSIKNWLLGGRAELKLKKLTHSIAALTMSFDNNGKLVIKKEHLDWVFNYIKSIYDRDTIGFKKQTDYDKKNNKITDKQIGIFNELIKENSSVFNDLFIQITIDSNKFKGFPNGSFILTRLNEIYAINIGKINISINQKFIKLYNLYNDKTR